MPAYSPASESDTLPWVDVVDLHFEGLAEFDDVFDFSDALATVERRHLGDVNDGRDPG